jgi:DNA-binding transcriptional ArsR family regulator
MPENILVLEPGDERAQKIAKAMASQTAGDILHLLGDGQVSLTDIAEKLGQPMNTVKYHVENLLEAGLISIAETKYSVKGREVKLYSLTNQLLIVAPRQSPVRSLILKYASLFAIVAIATLGIIAVAPYLAGLNGMPGMTGSAENVALSAPAPTVADRQVGEGNNVMAAKMAYGAGPETEAAESYGMALAFFLGGFLVIFVLLCYEAWLWKKYR